MKLLLDTHILLWALNNKLDEKITKLINDRSNTIYVSIASIWEVELKHHKKPQLMPISGEQLLHAVINSDYQILNIKINHFKEISNALHQEIHADPYDHALVAAAISEKMKLITHDKQILNYQNLDYIYC